MMAVESEGCSINQLTVENLKRELKDRNLPHVGPKTVLIKRLKKALQNDGEDPETYLFDSKEIEIASSSTEAPVKKTPVKKASAAATKSAVKSKKPAASAKKSCESLKDVVVKIEPVTDDPESVSNATTEENKVKEEETPSIKDDMKLKDQKNSLKDDNTSSIVKVKEEVVEKLDRSIFNEDVQDYEMDDPESVDSEKSNSVQNSPIKIEKSKISIKSEELLEKEYGDMMSDQDDDVIDFNGTEIDYLMNSTTDNDKISKTQAVGEKEKKKDPLEKSEKTKTAKKTTGKSGPLKGSEAKLSGSSEKNENKDPSEQKSLWVSGLSQSTKAAHLKETFSKIAKVASAKIVTNPKMPGSQCYGLVTVNSLEDAKKCIQALNVTELLGRFITVKLVKSPTIKATVNKSPPKSSELPAKKIKVDPDSKNVDQEKSKMQAEKKDAAKKEAEKKEAAKKELEKKEASKKEAARRDAERKKEAERREAEKREAERIKLEKERRAEREKLKQERMRQYQKEKELREAEKRAKLEEERQREIEKRHRMEVEKFEREREKLRIERENIERERAELLRLENYRLEREKEELKKEQMKLEEARRLKRSMPVPPDEYENIRKRPMTDRRPMNEERPMNDVRPIPDGRPFNQPTPNYSGYSNPSVYNETKEHSQPRNHSPVSRIEEKPFPPKEKKPRDVSERELLYRHHQVMKRAGLAKLEKLKRDLKRELRESQAEERVFTKRDEGVRKETSRRERRDYSPGPPKERYREEAGSSYSWENDYHQKSKMSPPLRRSPPRRSPPRRSPPRSPRRSPPRQRVDYQKKHEGYSSSHGNPNAPVWNNSKPPQYVRSEEHHNWPQSEPRKQEMTPWPRPPQPQAENAPWWQGNNSPARGGGSGGGRGSGRGMMRTLVPFRRQNEQPQSHSANKPIPTTYNNQKPPFSYAGRKY